MKLILAKIAAAIFFTAVNPASAQVSGSELSAAIDQVRRAYNVDLLLKAKTIRLEEDIRQDYPDHDYSADFHDMSAQRRHHVLDVQNEMGSSEYLTKISSNYYHGRSVFVDGKVRFILYQTDWYQDLGDSDFITEYGSTIRSSDVMLALWLHKAADSARYSGEEMWLGQVHDRITFDFPNSPELTILIQKDTGYISKMSRRVGNDILISYTFNYHATQGGTAIAQEHNVYSGTERIFFSFNRRIVLNDRRDRNAFKIEAGIVPEPDRVDQSEMSADVISETTHHVGQDEAYSSFFKTSAGLVAFGLEAGFAVRLTTYRAVSEDQSPLVFAIAANHHNIRIAGVSEAAAEGATILVTPSAEARVRSQLESTDQSAIVESVSDAKQIDSLSIYNVATSTASQNLIAYNEQTRSLIQTGHYAALYTNTPLFADLTGLTLLQSLKPLALSPDYIFSTESRRADEWEYFKHAVGEYVRTPCYRNRLICDGWD